MRTFHRPVLICICLGGVVQLAQSDAVPGGGVNYLGYSKNSPTPQSGGVDVSVDQKPTTGYTCTKMTIRVIDNMTGMTLDTYSVDNPGPTVAKSFTGLGGNRQIQVTVDATFQNGATFDPKRIMATTTTK